MMSFLGWIRGTHRGYGRSQKRFAAAIANKVHRPQHGPDHLAGRTGVFFSDSGNSLILGPIFRPIFDRLRISRAKLAYILDSTSSPVCILVPITGWGVYIMGIIATEFENLGIQTSDASAFVQAIPYQFYALLALVLVPLIALSKLGTSAPWPNSRPTLWRMVPPPLSWRPTSPSSSPRTPAGHGGR